MSKILKLNFTNITICKQFPQSHKVNERKNESGQRDNQLPSALLYIKV
nr:MAG TPA: hypothetical protein [Caudoviricetes sp.]